MKAIQLFSIVVAILIATTTYAQDIPKKEFTVSIADKSIQLLPGETKQIEVTLNRSKSYKKTEIELAIGSILPAGITIAFEDGVNPISDRIMIVTAAADTAPFQKTLILKAQSNRVNKAIMISMSVAEDSSLSAY